MASDREGPAASVVLSCDGCAFNIRHGNRHVMFRCGHPGGNGEEKRHPGAPMPQSCPLHPGKLVAVPVPETRNSPRGCLSRGEEAAIERYAAKDEGWNDCRSEIIQRARALGQEV